MANQRQIKCLLCLTLLLFAAFAGLGYRLVDLQILRHDELLAQAQLNTQREFLIAPRRGDILDARGNLLATSVFVKTVCVDPTILGSYQAAVARALAPVLQVGEAELYQKLLPRFRTNASGSVTAIKSVVLKRKVPTETWEKVRDVMSGLNFGVDEKILPPTQKKFFSDLRKAAVFTERMDDQLRVYPNKELASHVLGFVGMSDPGTNKAAIPTMVGAEGIERAMNSKLSGVRGWRETETDSHKREVVSLRGQDVEARDGLNVVLTIDSAIQHELETAMAAAMEKNQPLSISGVVIRPRTGEILAMATLPDFDPNNPGNNADVRRNRVITDVVEPGSTFKIVVVSGALNEKIVTLNDTFFCENGHFAYAGRVLHDHEAYPNLTVERIITKSSNIGAAKIGIKMGEEKLADYIADYGFGVKTGIALPGEVGGIVHPVKNWSKVSIAQIPMGHGIAVTRLQMLMAMCAIANDGWLMRPTIIKRLEDRDGNVVAQYGPERIRQVISEDASRKMVEALKTVVTDEGTAPKARLEHYEVAGKTGTAQKAGAGGYLPGKYISSFVGFFPADNPEVAISIVMDEPKVGYYGGQTAAPVFKQVAEHAANYLNVHPDLNPDSPDKTKTLAANDNHPSRAKPLAQR